MRYRLVEVTRGCSIQIDWVWIFAKGVWDQSNSFFHELKLLVAASIFHRQLDLGSID